LGEEPNDKSMTKSEAQISNEDQMPKPKWQKKPKVQITQKDESVKKGSIFKVT